MNFLISTVWSGSCALFLFLWSAAFFRCRHPEKIRRMLLVLCWGSLLLITTINPYHSLNSLFATVTWICLSFCLYKEPWYMHLIVGFFGILILISCEMSVFYLVASCLGVSFRQLVPRTLLYAAIGSTSYGLSLLIAWATYQLRRKHTFRIVSTSYTLLTLLYPLISMIALLFLFLTSQDRAEASPMIFLFVVFVAAANGAILFLLNRMEKQNAQMQETALLHQQMAIQTDSIAALEKNYREQRRSVHDFQNQLQTIHDLLAQEEPAQALSYVEQLQGIQTNRIFAINSRHPTIDAVLNQKYQLAKEKGIDVQVQVNDLSSVTVPTDSLVVILSNLLDNAIEACCQISGKPEIQFTLLCEEQLFLSVRNTSREVLIRDGEIPTTKEPVRNHGYGLPNVKLLLGQLGAEYAMDYENGWFQFVTEIPLP